MRWANAGASAPTPPRIPAPGRASCATCGNRRGRRRCGSMAAISPSRGTIRAISPYSSRRAWKAFRRRSMRWPKSTTKARRSPSRGGDGRIEGAQHRLVTGIVVHRLDAGKAAFARGIAQQFVRQPARHRIIEKLGSKAQRSDGATLAAKRLEGSLRPVLALLDQAARLLQDPGHRGLDRLRRRLKEFRAEQPAKGCDGSAAPSGGFAARGARLAQELGAVEWHALLPRRASPRPRRVS